MKFSEMVDQASEFLRRRERVSYRALKREFDLDDESLEDLKAELIDAQCIAVDEDGKVLVWVGASPVSSSEFQVSSSTQLLAPNTQPPSSYTPSHLAERIRAEQAALEARGATDGERKTITALFADLKGSTALIEGLDPEEARAIIDPALQLMMDAVHRYEGYVAQALGDGIFALFGAPLAHEDHPQRTLYAALRMQEEMRRYADTLRAKGYPPLLMRVGINTGEVVVRSIRKDDLHADYVPIGHSTNLAARMEQLAAPGSILVTEQTHKLTDGYFEFKALGQTQIKGVEAPLEVYEVLGAGPLRTKLQVTARRGLTRFVGRHSEMEQIQRALDQAKAGHGQIVGVMGEPGLGKSRLFYEFKLTSQSGCLVLEAYSVSHGKASSYLPVIELLKSYFQIQPQDDERTRRQKVIGKVLELDRGLEDTLPYLFSLLGVDDATSPLQQMDPQIRRRRTFDAIKKLFLRESLNQPLILVFEDLHWIDSETQGFLEVLSESVASAQILLLVNYRPEYRQEWSSKTYYTQLRLAPLGKVEAEELLTFLLGNDASLKVLKQLILEKTEGTPFFMEEVVQMLVENGTLTGVLGQYRFTQHGSLQHGLTLHLPPTVQGVLAARIDRLASDEKALLQHLAVIGREFPLSLARQVVTQPDEELYRVLASLQRKEFLYERPAFPEVEYIFKHALTQEVAYGTVLQKRRKVLHEQTARAIEALYSGSLDEHYSDLAHHYSRSGNTQKAVQYLHLAGQQAVQRSANAEAVSHLTTALELLKTLPDTDKRAQQELMLQIALGVPLMAIKGSTAPEVEQIYSRARDLCQQLGETSQLFWVLLGLWGFYVVRVERETMQELAEQMLHLAQSEQDSDFLVGAHYAQGGTLFTFGAVAPAREHYEQLITLYDPQRHRPYDLYGIDLGVGGRGMAAFILWLLGYPDQAQERMRDTFALAQQLSHSYSVAFALHWAALIHQLRREGYAAQEQAEATVALSNEQGFPMHLAWGTILQGWALTEQGQGEEGIIQIRQGLADSQAMGAEAFQTYFFALLAEAHGKVRQPEEGLDVLVEALALVDTIGECWYEAELYRLCGELTLQKGARGWGLEAGSPSPQAPSLQPRVPNGEEQEAEECFLKAIEIARKQQAKSLELRAVMSLVRLRQSQATQDASRIMHHETRVRFDEAHRMLSEIYNWFTEGFDTRDLQEAKTLLAQLS